ncbi:restriction endonuclease subunit S [Microbacterium elymi]|uniref:Restriction endonuclease subunit S n=1 Tax=Microbacterium elymi TaxID=2909587 RepID=A0ABY5NLH1_9MICO|nr:restriction endonuclease subunit S [Microbacterium elymi]UUT36007.1 restriction endonuclease subunit S [Microbacterium elymi]
MADIANPEPRSIAIGPFGSALRSDRYTSSGVPVVRGQNIGDRWVLKSDDVVYVAPETAAEFPACIVREGDLVFPHRGAIGRVALVGNEEWLLSSSMMKLTVNPQIADPRYVLLYFRSSGRDELLKRASTVGTPGIGQPLTSLRGIEVPLPPLPEQQAIAEVLGALDDKIAANTKLAATADQYLAALLDRELSLDHELTELGEIASVNADAVKPVAGGSLRYIDIASVAVGGFTFPELSSWDDAPGRARRRVHFGDTIWSTVRPNRRSHALNLTDDPLLVASTGLAVLSPRSVGFAYLYEVTRRPEFSAYLENVAEGSAYPAVRADRFLDAPVAVLTSDRVKRFEDVATPLRKHVNALATENRTLAATRDALLPQLMSGKLRVREAEAAASEVGV